MVVSFHRKLVLRRSDSHIVIDVWIQADNALSTCVSCRLGTFTLAELRVPASANCNITLNTALSNLISIRGRTSNSKRVPLVVSGPDLS